MQFSEMKHLKEFLKKATCQSQFNLKFMRIAPEVWEPKLGGTANVSGTLGRAGFPLVNVDDGGSACVLRSLQSFSEFPCLKA
jgi:hypothetical protein